MESKEAACLSKGLHSRLETLEKPFVAPRDNGWSYDSQVRSDVFCHPDVRCFYLTANKTAYISITKAFDQSEPRNRLLG